MGLSPATAGLLPAASHAAATVRTIGDPAPTSQVARAEPPNVWSGWPHRKSAGLAAPRFKEPNER